MKKVYKYYIEKDRDPMVNIYVQYVPEGDYTLYAFTHNKKNAKKFELLRNMKLFDKIVTEYDDDEYKDFCKVNRERLLDIHPFSTKYIDDNGIISSIQRPILSTEGEYEIACMSDGYAPVDMFDEDWWTDCPPITMFSDKKLVKSLKLLEYDKLQKLFAGSLMPTEDTGDYPEIDIIPDELEIFIAVFGDTFV